MSKNVKRLIDIFGSLFMFIILFPILINISFLVYIFIGNPIFFKQLRPGLNGKIFSIYKFRTMKNIFITKDNLSPDEIRLTKLGKFLRRFSLDELPELWNVIKGDMSLIGPRPLLVEYLNRYTPEQARRHEVKPGITGWAQVNGRNAITWEEKFKYDVWYVDNMSFWLDLKILYMTIIKVMKGEGISQPGLATTEEFKGTNG
jgi:lipopolysaccharide/colanic/teichoic acid biosynthesis glycosyltransferase